MTKRGKETLRRGWHEGGEPREEELHEGQDGLGKSRRRVGVESDFPKKVLGRAKG